MCFFKEANIVYIGCFIVALSLAQDLIVDLPDGTIRGSEITFQDKRYYAYRGIPFAAPPIGKLRFQSPVPPNPWDGILEANETQRCCISMSPDNQMSEDCLYLNVYTPARKITEKLPVLFWIYGGGFTIGCTSDVLTGPFYLLDEDVIVVYANYRLGLYGFLSTEDDVVLGNAGLKDQLLAMKWTKNNIALFGGDPEKITIFGESAGGISVGAHIVNTKSAELYRAAICQSGCSLTYIPNVSTQTNARQAAYDYAKYVDPTISEQNTTTEIRDFLQSLPANVLTPAYSANSRTGISIEVEHEDAYVTNLSFPLLESGNFNQVPVIIGTTSAETLPLFAILGGELAARATAATMDSDLASLIPADLVPLPGTNATDVGSQIREAYVGPNGTFGEHLGAVIEITSDQLFVRSTLKQAEIQSNFAPVYVYQFSFAGSLNSLPSIEGAGRAGHVEDTLYLFSFTPLVADRDILISKQIVKLWANFAKTLNPTPDPADPLFNLTWPQVSPNNIQYLDFDDEIAVKPNRKEKQMAMWNDVYYTYGQQPFPGF
ncbi:juvenile hormone esterase-like isoform X2 [Cylas formicarius]|uniref:juvenile hormone esterase-like isoform X2 n=1 Tax=Cylas formicarius TaxID=197179 RepID=UPI0029588890|nr:juvenile hormone esterase-like isoform X2 [Cylas formicarius]